MKVTNTFMHNGSVLRPGDAIPGNVSNGELQAWKNNGLIGENYGGPTRRSQPNPAEIKPVTLARRQRTPRPAKQRDSPKPIETKATDARQSENDSDSQLLVAVTGIDSTQLRGVDSVNGVDLEAAQQSSISTESA